MTSNEAHSPNEVHFDPDALPHIDPVYEREHSSYFKEYADPRSARLNRSRIAEFMRKHNTQLEECAKRLVYSTADSFHGRAYDSGVVLPISVASESVGALEETFDSVNETVAAFGGRTCVLAWLNFAADDRRERGKFEAEAAEMIEEIPRMLPIAANRQSGSDLVIALDKYGAQRKIPEVRHRSSLGLGYIAAQAHRDSSRQYGIYDTFPHTLTTLFWDADTTLSPDALPEADDLLRSYEALMVNGRLRYVGGVMDIAPDDLGAKHGSPYKLLYLAEHMRRLMMEHIPPNTNKSYRAESGLAMQLGPLFTLGGFNTNAENNESYWLAQAAVEASKYWYSGDMVVTGGRGWEYADPPDTDPYLNNTIATKLQHLHRYGSYHVDTSIRGLERMVVKAGPHGLKDYDQGHHYTLWSHSQPPEALDYSMRLPLSEELQILDATHDFFRRCGGALLAEDILEFNALVSTVLVPGAQEPLVWLPSKANQTMLLG